MAEACKLHFAVNVETHEVVAMEVTTDDVHDVRKAPSLVDESGRNVRVSRVYGDAAYDSSAVYSLLEERGIEVVVKPKVNARCDRDHPSRRRAASLIRGIGYDASAGLTGYGRRGAVETAYSTFKRLFGEHSLARSFENIVVELVGKVAFV
ncbi:TPA: transposase [Candidatus Bathyarchaeota archaeon]|nr:transposase [Candidatus Bathyarchaeota archaeon]